ncbi:AEC family transporter [Methylobacterium nonmethylotrophicum]|uniref:AEC family transporter n=2 Tax=Methylobacterium nonmethylotrophicum TaxID=1141884 RepID=A0A4Z0NUL5_9HYPH|nr:AEC family transporter [Methylobacterium nonmethylotrophicum]
MDRRRVARVTPPAVTTCEHHGEGHAAPAQAGIFAIGEAGRTGSHGMSHLAAIASTLVSVILPVFGLIVIGRLIIRFGIVDRGETKGLTGLIFWVLLPSLLFLSIIGSRTPPRLDVIGTYFAVALPLFALSVLGGIALLRLTIAQAAVFGLNAVFGNTVLLGIPIVGAIWGGAGLAVLLSIIAAHSLLLLPAATVLVELDRGVPRDRLVHTLRDTITGSLKNPIISSIVAATLWNATGLPLPEGLRRMLDLLAQAAPALALISLGASLPVLRRETVGPSVLLAVGIKLAVMPLGMGLAVTLAGIPAPASLIMIVTAALPTGANAFLLAHRSGAMMEVSAATVVVATVLSVATLTGILSAAL